MQKVRVADIAIDPRSGGAEALYSYRVEGPVEPGDAFFVPLGNRSVLGFVTFVYDTTEVELGFPIAALKGLGSRVENLALPSALVELAKFVAAEYLCTLPVALSPTTPPGVRERLVTAWTLVPGVTAEGLTPMQREVVRTMEASGGSIQDSPTKKLPASAQRSLRLLRGKGLVVQSLKLIPYGEKRKSETVLTLTANAEKVEKFLHTDGKKKPAQALTLMRLQTAEHPALTPSEIKALAGVTETTVRALVDAGLLEQVDQERRSFVKPPQPNPHQQLAIDAVTDAIQGGRHQSYLMYGITGSGKTEAYLRLAAEALRHGRQVLYLVPEIALATQAIAQLRDRFGMSVAVLHSELPPGERLQNWLRIRNGEAPVVLGARSALFAPLGNIGLIVMDEEHEASYKQESAPRYHTKRLATFLAERHKCPLVLGSATPSIESFYEAELEKLTLLSLPQRAASAKLPAVTIEDLTIGYRLGQPALLGDTLVDRIRATLARKEQVILFLNRRAYSPFLICRDCSYQPTCPHCAVSLSYHMRDRRLRCHHCGHNVAATDICPKCGGSRLKPFGAGTEKVEEAVLAAFPEAKVARLDRDIARKKGALEATLAGFRSEDLNILVGTQMVAKGLDFPKVTLVGVIAADTSLNIPDFRSSERTFQLLTQVAGRAGRSTAPGTVVIQTLNPEHIAIRTAQTHDFPAFYEALKQERSQAGYPPFTRLINVLLSGESRSAVVQAANEAAALIFALGSEGSPPPTQPTAPNDIHTPCGLIQLLGPVDCALERIQGRWRRHILLKLQPSIPPSLVGGALEGFLPKHVGVVVDVDPHSLM